MSDRIKPPLPEDGKINKPSAESLAELSDLVSQLRFSDRHADLRIGEHWRIYAHPWASESEGYFDALINIIACQPEIECQGIRLWVEQGNIRWLPSSTINQRGQFWFRRLPQSGWYSMRLLIADAPSMEEDEESGLIRLVGKGIHVDAEPIDENSPQQQKIFLTDRRIFASLERNEQGNCVITIQTEDPGLPKTIVRFSIAGEFGEVELSPEEGIWSVHRLLSRPFREAERYALEFELTPLKIGERAMTFQQIAIEWQKLPRSEKGVLYSEPQRRLFRLLFAPSYRGWFNACRAWVEGGPSPEPYSEITELIVFLGKSAESKDRQIMAQAHLDCSHLLLNHLSPPTQEICQIVSQTGLQLGFIRELWEELGTGRRRSHEGEPVHTLFPLVIVREDRAVLAKFIFERIPNGFGDIYLDADQGFTLRDAEFKRAMANSAAYARTHFSSSPIDAFDIRVRIEVLDKQAVPEIEAIGGPSIGFAFAMGLAKCFSALAGADSEFARKLAAINLPGVAFTGGTESGGNLFPIDAITTKVIRLIFSPEAQAHGAYVLAVDSKQAVPNMRLDEQYALLPPSGIAPPNVMRSEESLLVVRAPSVSQFVKDLFELQSKTIVGLLNRPSVIVEYLLGGTDWFLPLIMVVLLGCWYFLSHLWAITGMLSCFAAGILYGWWHTRRKHERDPLVLPPKALYSRLDWAAMALTVKEGQYSRFQKSMTAWLAPRLSKSYLSDSESTLEDAPGLWRRCPLSWKETRESPRAWFGWSFYWLRLLIIFIFSLALFSPLQYWLGELIPYGGKGEIIGGSTLLAGGAQGGSIELSEPVEWEIDTNGERKLRTQINSRSVIRLSISDKPHAGRKLRVLGDGYCGLKESDDADSPADHITVPLKNGKATFQVILDVNNPFGTNLTIQTLSNWGTVLKEAKLTCQYRPISSPISLSPPLGALSDR
jgi:hypothetical protein